MVPSLWVATWSAVTAGQGRSKWAKGGGARWLCCAVLLIGVGGFRVVIARLLLYNFYYINWLTYTRSKWVCECVLLTPFVVAVLLKKPNKLAPAFCKEHHQHQRRRRRRRRRWRRWRRWRRIDAFFCSSFLDAGSANQTEMFRLRFCQLSYVGFSLAFPAIRREAVAAVAPIRGQAKPSQAISNNLRTH